MPSSIAVIPGDGVGPEVTAEAIATLEAAAPGAFTFTPYPYGAEHTLATGETIAPAALRALRDDHDAILLGALGDTRIPDHRHARDILLGMRTRFDLYANVRPARLRDARLTPLKGLGPGDIDLIIFRENTEGLYADIGGILKPGTPDEVALNQMVASRRTTERLLTAAFTTAASRPRRRCCLVSKHNAIRYSHGLWVRVFDEVAALFPEVEAEILFADVAAMELVRNPQRFDVVATSNMLGDVLSDLTAQLAGGLGLAASSNLHLGPDRPFGLFEPVHGSAPGLVGRALANPSAAILSAARMAAFLGHADAAARIEAAVDACVLSGQTTPDLGGTLSTQAAGDAIRARLGPAGAP